MSQTSCGAGLPGPGLGAHLAARIRAGGPLTVAQYMSEALAHPDFGYYTTRQPFGLSGDFVTAPEVSQMFGEMIGLWCADVWSLMGRPAALHWVELGPGRGTLCADAWRAARVQPGFQAAAHLHLVETSPRLRAVQAATLRAQAPDAAPRWHDALAGVPAGPLILVANELLDALPVRQFERARDGWRERVVTLDGDGALRFALADTVVDPAVLPAALRGAAVGAVAEVCPAAQSLVAEAAARVIAHGGAALFIDFGTAASEPGDTLQAVRNHGFHPVLIDPGAADLAASVDFAVLCEAAHAAGARVWGPVTQGAFLSRLGIGVRAERLKTSARGKAQAIDADLARLLEPALMGSLFKVMAVAHPDLPMPAGFEGSGAGAAGAA